MQAQQENVPVRTLHLFPILDALLIDLLKSLNDEEWKFGTIAKLWTVKDIAAHLLDGNLRTLSASRDHYFGENPIQVDTYADLVKYLNHLNHSWTDAAKRLSPAVLIELLTITGKQFYEHLSSLAPFDKAIFSVAWAGQQESYNWFHIAREYTEKFLHQQQIRAAVGKQALFTRELFYPFMDTFMYGLPYTYRNVDAPTGTMVTIKVTTDIGGIWTIAKNDTAWQFTGPTENGVDAVVCIHPDTAWKLFSKGISCEDAIPEITLTGDKELGRKALEMVAVMA